MTCRDDAAICFGGTCLVGDCGVCAMTDGQVTLREHIDTRIDGVIERIEALAGQVGALVDRVGIQNGRVSKLELLSEVGKVRDEERERARQEAARIAAETAKRAATTRATIISLAGLLLSAVGMWLGR